MDTIPQGKTDKDDNKRQKLQAFISTVSSGRLVQFWESAVELRANAIVSLTKAFSESPQTGWVRADTAASASTMADIIKYRNENDTLREEINNLKEMLLPKYKDAAGLDATINIYFNYTSSTGNYKKNINHEISFSEFLKWIAGEIHTPASISSICAAVSRALKERAGIYGTNFVTQQAAISDGLLHLVATGHVTMWASRTSNGQNVTAYQLTPLGEQAWKEMAYIKVDNSQK